MCWAARLKTIPSTPSPTSFEEWLDETFGRAVTGGDYPQFVHRDVREWPDPVADELALEYLIRLFEGPEEALRYFSDRQIAAGLWELGPGDMHCVHNGALALDARERLIGSVEIFFRDFFNLRCLPKLAHLDTEHTEPLNGICYMWWEVTPLGAAQDDPDAERLNGRVTDVLEAVLSLSNPARKEAALHGLGHSVRKDGRAATIVERFLANAVDLDPALDRYARAALSGCIQ